MKDSHTGQKVRWKRVHRYSDCRFGLTGVNAYWGCSCSVEQLLKTGTGGGVQKPGSLNLLN